jgi:hypothetical protein
LRGEEGSALDSEPRLRVEVVDDRRQHEIWKDCARTARELLELTPRRYLAGLDSVVLRDQEGLSREERLERERHPNRLRLGGYFRQTRSRRARIELYPDAIAAQWPSVCLRVAALREMLLARTLFHELGHHIQTRVDPRPGGKEPVAQQWGRRLSREVLARRHPCLRRLGFLRAPLQLAGRLVERFAAARRGPT